MNLFQVGEAGLERERKVSNSVHVCIRQYMRISSPAFAKDTNFPLVALTWSLERKPRKDFSYLLLVSKRMEKIDEALREYLRAELYFEQKMFQSLC